MIIDVTNHKHSYLRNNTKIEKKYFEGLSSSLNQIKSSLSSKEFSSLIKDKLQVTAKKFNEAQYLQAACELTICAYLAKKYNNGFEYEPKLNPPKDVDCCFEQNGFKVNIEIKCADFSKKKDIDSQHALKLGSFGRAPNYKEFEELAQKIAAHTDMALIKQQHMDNKLKDFLLSAHEKFSDNSGEELNILAICCDDASDIQKWFGYMYATEGLFSPESFFKDFSLFNSVDVVLLTNLHHRHSDYSIKDKISNHWDFEQSFNLIFSNPKRKSEKKEQILNIIEAIPNYSMPLGHFEVKGNIEQEAKDSMRINHFVVEELQSNGIYLFQPIK